MYEISSATREYIEVAGVRSILLTIPCPLCRKGQTIKVSEDAYDLWMDGALVQDAFPELTPDEREVLVSGFCPHCWNDMFPPEDEEDVFLDTSDISPF